MTPKENLTNLLKREPTSEEIKCYKAGYKNALKMAQRLITKNKNISKEEILECLKIERNSITI